MMKISTTNRLTILLGRLQAQTGQRVTLRGLATQAGVPKDLVYRLDAGEARYVDLAALASLCGVLGCLPADILLWQKGTGDSGEPAVPAPAGRRGAEL
jgi:DNA-binding Xre family transcriptional regulator